jgi:hypothetical protein
MSDVEKWIEQWRTHLTGSELLAGSDIDEMESHLREEIEHLKTSGLDEEEAFLIARRRLGDTAVLEEEFAKVSTHRLLTNRLWWMIAGVLAYSVAAHFAGVIAQVSVAIAQATSLSPQVLGFIALAVQVSMFSAVGALVLWLCVRYSRPGVRPHIRLSRRLRLVFLLGLLVETMAVFIIGWFAVPYTVSAMTLQNYTQVVMVRSVGNLAWTLVGPVLLAALLMAMHFAGRQRAETQ